MLRAVYSTWHLPLLVFPVISDRGHRICEGDSTNWGVVKASELVCSSCAVVLEQVRCYVGWDCQGH